LGHIISPAGVIVDPKKVKAVLEWPVPKSLRALRGFLDRILQEIHQGL